MSKPPQSVERWMLRALMGEAPPPADVQVQAARWWRLAEDQGVLPLLCARLTAFGVVPELSEQLQKQIKRQQNMDVAADMLREAELREVLQQPAVRAEAPLLLKGAALAYSHYPEPHLRPRCDSDLLFPSREGAERAWKALETMGFSRPLSVASNHFSHQFSGHRKTAHGGFTLDIHWRVSNKPLFAAALGYPELAARAVAIPALGPAAYGLHPTQALLFAAMHRIGHAAEGSGNRWIWLYDIHLLSAGLDPADWAELTQMAEDKGLCGILLDALLAVQGHFGGEVPAGFRQRLEDRARSERFGPADFRSPLRMHWADFRALPGFRSRWEFVREHLGPDAAYMRQKYPDSRAPLAWLYLRRAFGGVIKTLRR